MPIAPSLYCEMPPMSEAAMARFTIAHTVEVSSASGAVPPESIESMMADASSSSTVMRFSSVGSAA